MRVLSEQMITDAEAKEILERIGKVTELKFEQKNALETLNKFVKADAEKARKLVDELRKIERLREREIIAIVNFLPEDSDDLMNILQKEFATFSKEEIAQILETVRKGI